MHKALTIVLLAAVFAAAMLAISYLVPQIRAFTGETSQRSHLPWIVVGLFAPILYVVKRAGDWVKGLLSSPAEQAIEDSNRAIKEQLAQLRANISSIEARRVQEMREHQQKIDALDARLKSVLGEIGQVDADLDAVRAKPDAEFAPNAPGDTWETFKKKVPGFVE